MSIEFKDIEGVVIGYRSLIEISCHHEDVINHTINLHETFFLNENNEVVAHFQDEEPFHVQQMHNGCENLFAVSMWRDEERFRIIWVENGVNTVLNTYDNIEFGIEDGTFAVKKNGLWGFIDDRGKEIISPQYKDYFAFQNGLASVIKDDKWGFIDKNNNTVIPFEYNKSEHSSFSLYDGIYCAPVTKGGKTGFIDKQNNVIIPFEYDGALTRCEDSSSKIFGVKKDGKWGFIDKNNDVVIPFEFDDVEINDTYPYFHPFNKCDDKELYGLIDVQKGELVLPCKYYKTEVAKNSISIQKADGKYVLLDLKLNETSKEYDYIDYFPYDGIYIAERNGKGGYIDEFGKEITPFKYRENNYHTFHSGYATPEYENFSRELINKEGKVLYKASSRKEFYNLGNGSILVENKKTRNYTIIKIEE